MDITERSFETGVARDGVAAAKKEMVEALPTAPPDRHIGGIYIFIVHISQVDL